MLKGGIGIPVFIHDSHREIRFIERIVPCAMKRVVIVTSAIFFDGLLVILLASSKGHYIVAVLEAKNTRINGRKNLIVVFVN